MKYSNPKLSRVGLAGLVMLLAACGGDGSASKNGLNSAVDTNVAASSSGAVASSDFNSGTVANVNDEDESTTWVSDPDVPLVIDFGASYEVTQITIDKTAAAVSAGTNPDINVELSTDGSNYSTSALTRVGNGDIPCTSTSITSTQLECDMDEYTARYIRITSQNGKSFEFQEISVIAKK